LQEIGKIVLVGAGNVAIHMGLAMKESGLNIVQVYSRTRVSAQALAGNLQTTYTTDLKSIVPDAYLYIIAVSDDAVEDVIRDMDAREKFVVHTSGSIPMEVFQPFAQNFGVMYPLQTFSKNRKVDFSHIPLCIEANSLKNLELLNSLASKMTSDVRTVSSDQRKVLHLAAVFACNFPNFMYSIAELIMRKTNLDFNLLKPLIIETAEKVQSVSPGEAQTGPAWRGDRKVIEDHLEMLKQVPGIRDLYKQISQEIGQMKK